MKVNKIVGFGDSWMYGDELLDPHLLANYPDAHTCWYQNTDYREAKCFLGLIGDRYKLPTRNFGIPGGSLQSTIWTYLWWLEREPSPQDALVLLVLTEADRQSFYNPNYIHYSNDPQWNKFVHSTWVEYGASVVPTEWRDMVKRHTVLTVCEEFRVLNYLQTLLFFDGHAARNNIPMIITHTAEPPMQRPCSLIPWSDHDWCHFFRDHPKNQNRELIKEYGHPNELGHEVIRDALIPEIDRVILA